MTRFKDLPFPIKSLPEDTKSKIKEEVISQIKPVLNKRKWMKRALSDRWLLIAFLGIIFSGGIWTAIALIMRSVAIRKLSKEFSKPEIVNMYNICLNKVVNGFNINDFYKGFKNRYPFNKRIFKGSYKTTTASGVYQGKHQFETGNDYIIIHQKNSNTYVWWRYFMIQTDYQGQYDTTVEHETKLTRFFQGHRKSKLESMEFEKIFKMDYKFPIKLREIFTPSVMAKMTDIVKKDREFKMRAPSIFIHNNYLGFRWYVGMTGSPKYRREILFMDLVRGAKNMNQIAERFCDKITLDLNRFYVAKEWFEALNLIKENVDKQKISKK